MEAFILFDSSSEEDTEKVVRRNLRDSSNPLELPEQKFIKRFRVSKEAFKYVMGELDLASAISSSVPPVLKLSCTLSLLAGGAYQHQVGNDYMIGMAQSTVSKILKGVLDEMEQKLCPKWIKFTFEEECKMWFLEKYGIPGVIGCIDGTHISLLQPRENEHMFYNRKGRHSLNAMIICDHKGRIMAVDSRFGGASHDSFVWAQSEERLFLEGTSQGWLLGDSGYPLEPFCLKPYRLPVGNTSQSNFNTIHSKARCVVERCIGVYKGRWRILLDERKARYIPEKVAKFANVCAALHNICVHYRINFDVVAPPDDSILHVEYHETDVRDSHRTAERTRNNIASALSRRSFR